jgi:hypothetical protein
MSETALNLIGDKVRFLMLILTFVNIQKMSVNLISARLEGFAFTTGQFPKASRCLIIGIISKQME